MQILLKTTFALELDAALAERQSCTTVWNFPCLFPLLSFMGIMPINLVALLIFYRAFSTHQALMFSVHCHWVPTGILGCRKWYHPPFIDEETEEWKDYVAPPRGPKPMGGGARLGLGGGVCIPPKGRMLSSFPAFSLLRPLTWMFSRLSLTPDF